MKRFTICFVLASLLCVSLQTQAQDVKKKVKDDKVKMKKDEAKMPTSQAINVANVDTSNQMPDMSNMSVSSNAGKGEMLPYTATYSSQFEMADAAISKMILELWKDWDDNNFSRHADYFADTVTMIFTNGQVVKGKENLLNSATQHRGSLASAKSVVDAWLSTRSVDKDEKWVAIWGSETDTNKDGKESTMRIHEIWKFNKDGKVDFMQQYTGQMPGM